MNRIKYLIPEIEVIEMEMEEVIAASDTPSENDNNDPGLSARKRSLWE